MTATLRLDDGTELIRNWDFEPTRASTRIRALRLRNALLHRVAAPASELLKSGNGGARWAAYFVFLADGGLQPAHRFTLERLASTGRRLLVVCAAPNPAAVPGELIARSDICVWKALPGFDFSAYALALRTLAEYAPGAETLVLNDSVFGPFGDFESWLAPASWDLTGFTATANVENHLQSFAFQMREVTSVRIGELSPILGRTFDSFWDVVLNQENQFARVAARNMSVGALLYAPPGDSPDPMLQRALPLVRAGFPFLKRSLLGKLAHLHPREDVLATLEAAGHPRP